VNTYANTRPPTDPFPGAADIYSLPHVKAMLENPSLEAYTNLESFAELHTQLPSIFSEWVSYKNKELLALMHRAAATPGDSGPDELYRLELATTFFKCSECIEPISYPNPGSRLDPGHCHRERYGQYESVVGMFKLQSSRQRSCGVQMAESCRPSRASILAGTHLNSRHTDTA
jgi:hypothetical protein